jgi:hypothetical protein
VPAAGVPELQPLKYAGRYIRNRKAVMQSMPGEQKSQIVLTAKILCALCSPGMLCDELLCSCLNGKGYYASGSNGMGCQAS